MHDVAEDMGDLESICFLRYFNGARLTLRGRVIWRRIILKSDLTCER